MKSAYCMPTGQLWRGGGGWPVRVLPRVWGCLRGSIERRLCFHTVATIQDRPQLSLNAGPEGLSSMCWAGRVADGIGRPVPCFSLSHGKKKKKKKNDSRHTLCRYFCFCDPSASSLITKESRVRAPRAVGALRVQKRVFTSSHASGRQLLSC